MPDAALVQAAIQAATAYGIPPDLFVAQIQQESSFNPNAVNGQAQGIAQFMPGTAKQFGLTNPYDPIASLQAAAQYDAQLYAQTGSYASMLGKYGTVPTSGPLTKSQQSLLTQAQSFDAGKGGGAGGATTNVAGPGASGNCASCTGSTLGDFFVRVGLVLLALILIWQGLAMLRGSSVHENITVMVKGAKGKATTS